MSKQIDERVVSMRFDNKHFESNVQTSMSTLDKLKAKLNLSGASKGLENVNSAAKKVDMSGLAGGIETVSAKFSSLQVVGVTALANITNSAINAGKRFVESLTIAPIKDGFSEYELTLNAVQTTMSGTGKTAEEVEKQLKSLDEYADKTVYSTADMLNNLPKFTNAGVDLEKATTAMIGIANATALAGGDAGKASIAFYNLGQAIGTGYLTRMDYNSINNAGIATMEWKNQMVDAAIAAGTLTKAGDDLYAAGDKTFTLQQLFIDGLQEQWATTDVMMKVFGDYGDETTEIGKKAYSAAQDVKTFSQMMESLKATAGTGWKDTWQTIFGGLDEAKQFWTDLSNSLSGIITGIANWRNKLLNGALGKGFSKLSKTLSTITDPIKKTVKTVKGATTAIKNLGEMANRVIRGEFGNGKARFEALTKAGYNYYAIQNKVNEKLGYAFRYSDKLAGSQKELTTTEEELTSADAKRLEQLSKMSDEELENLGLTKKQIKALRELKKYVDMTGLSFSEFVENIDEIDGRWLLINSFKNVGQGLVAVFKALKDAWVEIFPPMTSDQLFNIIGGLHKFSTHLRVSEETAENLKRTLKGVFAALDIVLTIVGGPIKIAFKILMQLLKAFDLDILDVTAVIGDAIVKFRDWIDSTIDFTGIFKTIAPYIKEAIDAVKGWIDSVKPLEKIEAAFKKVTDAVKDFAKSIRESDIVQNIISGLTNGLKNGASKVWKAIVDLAKGMLEKIKSVLGIHSPSTEFEEVGENAVLGLANGLKGGISTIANIIKTLCSKMFSAFGEFDWSNISTIFTNIARLFPKLKIFTTISALGNIFAVGGKDVVMGFVNGLAKSASAIWEAITSIAKNVISKFKDILGIHSPSAVFFAIGGFIIAGLVGGLMSGSANIKDALTALGSWVINFFKGLDLGTVVAAGATIGALILIKKILDITDKFASAAKSVGGLADSLKNLADNFNTKLFGQFNKSKWELISEALLKMAIAIGILAASVIIMSMIEPGKLWGAVGALGVLIVALGALAGIIVGLMAATKLVGDGKSIAVIGNMLLKIAIAMGIMAVVAKIAGSMYSDDLKQGALAIVAFGGIIVALMWATKLLGNSAQISTIGGTLVKISYAIGIMLLVAKSAASMTVAELKQGIQAIAAFSGIIIALMAATRLVNGGEFTDKVGKSIFKIAGAIAIMLIVAKIAASMSIGDIVKGTLTIAAFSGIIIGLMKAAKTISGAKNVDKIGGAILKMAFAMTLMAIAAKIAASMSIGEIVQGTLAIAAFGGMVVGLMAATKLVGDGKSIAVIGNMLLKIAIAMGIMA
ncbi:MAG: hypothetical protein IJ022_06335, partial [Burkholderiaceae bacterium]|nr:hypothetical protein [Burkholderiaceae bacterium]